MTFDAVLFDLDGVLVDSEPLHEEAARTVLRRHDVPVPADLFVRFRGRPDRVLFSHVVEAEGRDDLEVADLIGEKEAAYRSMGDRMRPVAGATDLLERLAQAGVARACVTSATRADQQAVFDALGLQPHFAAVVTADDVDRPKPDPEPYRRGAKALGIDPAACAVVEDSPHGLRAARQAGCTGIGLTTSTDAAALQDAGAAYVADRHDAVARWLFNEA
jgi:HAD superfamily hydrolase (TIGR01509 family)